MIPAEAPGGADELGEETRIPVGPRATYLGESSGSHFVGTVNDQGTPGSARILRISPDSGEREVVVRRLLPWNARLSTDGSRIFGATMLPRGERTRFEVHDAASGEKLSSVVLAERTTLLAARRSRAWLTSDSTGTRVVDTAGRTRKVVHPQRATAVDLSSGLAAFVTAEPFDGGCSRVTRLARPSVNLWTSCREVVSSFAPDGRSLVTVDMLSDGIGPNRVWVRSLDGTLLARYRSEWFSDLLWESADSLILGANTTLSALVRCTGAVCENATDPKPLAMSRSSAGSFRASASTRWPSG